MRFAETAIMNALELLTDEHCRIEELFDRFQQAETFDARRSIFEEIRSRLIIHARVEESAFYPFIGCRDGFRESVDDALERQQDIRDILTEASSTRDHEAFEDLVDELIEAVDQHIDDEEGILFAKIRSEMSESDLEDLGAMLERTRETHFPLAA